MLIRFIVIVAFFLLIPGQGHAITFNCCECGAENRKTDFCVTVPSTKNCSFAANEINKQTDQKFNVTCSNLNNDSCYKINTKPAARCSNEPLVYTKIDNDFFAANEDDKENATEKAAMPVLGVPIPGASFPDELIVKDNKVQVPYLAIYLYALHKYLIGIGLITAAMMLIYGGFLYILGSTGAKISDAKEKIKDAVLGLSVLLASVVILSMINPNTTTNPTMEVVIVGKNDWPEDPVQGRKLVEEAATIKWNYSLPAYSSVNVGSDEPVTAVYIPPESVVRNSHGLAVAQGVCPGNMIKIPYTEEYKTATKVSVPTFCIDKFEAPNRAGVKPLVGMLNIEAAYWCDMHGKRLCTQAEWQRACRGPSGTNQWGIKDATSFTPGVWVRQGMSIRKTDNPPAPCNYDSYNPDNLSLIKYRDQILGKDFGKYYPYMAEASIWVPEQLNSALMDEKYREAYYAAKKFLEEMNAPVEISGSRVRCQTDEGVFDMIGNVQEIVLAERKSLNELRGIAPSAKNYDGLNNKNFRWMNWYWSPIAHGDKRTISAQPTCNNIWGGGHSMGWRGFENGFRCCMDYSEPTTSTIMGIEGGEAVNDQMSDAYDPDVPDVVSEYISPPMQHAE